MASAPDQTVTGKFPVPPLSVTAYTAKQPKKRKSAEEKKDAKRLKDTRRAKTRINIGNNHSRWRKLRDRLGLTLDLQLAQILLDNYEKNASLPQHADAVCVEELKEEPEERDETPSLTSSAARSLLSKPGSKFPSRGFVSKIQNGNEPLQPQSIEVTLEMEQTEEPVSGADQSDGESEEEEEEEEEGEEDEEEEESEGSGVDQKDDDWTPTARHQRAIKDVEEESEYDEEDESGDESGDEKPRRKRQLCAECGAFFWKSHTCDLRTRPFVCNMCGRRFISESSLKHHSHLHLETHEFYCKYCNVSFKTKANKLAHEPVHLNQKDPYKCPDCTLTFPTFRKRAAHKKKHVDKNTCKMCGLSFQNEHSFLRHVAVHTGERPFKCSACDMSFKQDSHLKSHMRLHTGERPYTCKHCPKAFNHNVSLKSHLQKYHPDQEEEEEDGETKTRGKWCTTGRPKGRPKRSADEKKTTTRRKRFKTEQDTYDYESEEDST